MHSNTFILDDKVHFASGLTDKNALRGKPAELVCKLSTDKIDGVWYKDGNKVCLCIITAISLTGKPEFDIPLSFFS